MTFRGAVAALVDHLRELAQELGTLGTIVAEDAPSNGSAFVDRLRESVAGAQSLADEALDDAERAFRAIERQPDRAGVRRELTEAHRALANLERALVSDVASTRHRDELARLAGGRRKGWAAWAGVVRDTTDRCVQQLHDVGDDLVQAFEELLDPDVVSVAVAVHTVDQRADERTTGDGRIPTTERTEGVR